LKSGAAGANARAWPLLYIVFRHIHRCFARCCRRRAIFYQRNMMSMAQARPLDARSVPVW
jgi:hypothetical protein